MPLIDQDAAVINAVRMAQQSADPAAPSTGGWKLYFKSGGLFIENAAGTVTGPLAVASGGGVWSAYLLYQDQKAQNTAGGTFTAGAWRTRDMNTEVVDTGNNGSVASNQITLLAGTYDCEIFAPAFYVANHQARLQNVTDSTTLVVGTTMYTSNTNPGGVMNASMIRGRFTLSATKVLEVQHQSVGTQATNGFGVPANLTTEIYTTAAFYKV